MKQVHNIFGQLQIFEKEIARLEGRVLELEQKLEKLLEIERNHLIRIKNGEEISDEFILNGRPYQDLTPEKAWRLYKNPDYDFVFLDVTSQDFQVAYRPPEALHIPWEQFADRFYELTTRTTPIF